MIFWLGFIALALADPTLYRRPQPAIGPRAKLLGVAFVVVLGAAIGFVLWGIIHQSPVNLFWALVLIGAGSLSMLLMGIASARKDQRAEDLSAKTEEINKNL